MLLALAVKPGFHGWPWAPRTTLASSNLLRFVLPVYTDACRRHQTDSSDTTPAEGTGGSGGRLSNRSTRENHIFCSAPTLSVFVHFVDDNVADDRSTRSLGKRTHMQEQPVVTAMPFDKSETTVVVPAGYPALISHGASSRSAGPAATASVNTQNRGYSLSCSGPSPVHNGDGTK